MESFTFFNPTHIEFGADKERAIGGHMAQRGAKKVLLCFGSDRIKRDGLFDTVTQSLSEQGIKWVEFGGIVSNPVISKVREGIAVARAHGVDSILAVGGGSVLDSAKAIAAGVLYEGDVWDLFIGQGAITSALPVFDVMTLAATGSEMNPTGVVTNEAIAAKLFIMHPALFPKVSVINPALMSSVSTEYLVYSAADVIAHVIETYFTASDHPHLQSRLDESLIKTVIEATEILLASPDNLDARGEFAWSATLALNGLTSSGTAGSSYPNHALEHSLSALFNVPHGAGLSVVMPAWMKWYRSRNGLQFDRFAREIFGAETGEEGIAALEAWFDKIGTPTRLPQLGIKEEDLPQLKENMLGNVRGFGIGELYTPEVIETILRSAL